MKQKLIIIICILIFFSLIIYNFFIDDNSTEIATNNFYEAIPQETNKTLENIVVHIDGAIAKPGIVKIAEGSRIIDVIDAAGGLTELADISKINLAYIVSDAQKIYIPTADDLSNESYISNSAGVNVLESNSFKTNINTASQTELESLPGIGASTAQKIINYRNEHGKFQKAEDIMNVSGIGESKYSNIKDYITTK